jgi:hypothetical protein
MALRGPLAVLLATCAYAVAATASSPALSPLRRLGCVVYLTDGTAERVAMLFRSLRSLEYNVNARWHYPVVIFYNSVEERTDRDAESTLLTSGHRDALQWATSSELIFAPIDFSEYADAPGVAGAPTDIYGKSITYRHMCRFFAGDIARHPALAPFRYYLRLDVDTVLLSALSETDVFAEMAANSWRYGHGALQCDWHVVTEGLWEVAEAHFGQRLSQRLQPPFRDASCLRSAGASPGSFNNRIYYNNFEIVDLEFLRSSQYQAFFGAVNAAGGLYTKRWGDAPIRTLAVQALLPPSAVHHFRGALYWHQALFGIDWALLMTGALAVLAMLCAVTGFCGAPLVSKVLVARAFPSTAHLLVRAWRSAAARTMDAALCIACCCSCRLQKRRHSVEDEGRPARSAVQGGRLAAGSGGQAVLATTRRSATHSSSSSSSATSGDVLSSSLRPVIIPIPLDPSARAPSADQLASARSAARRWAVRAASLVCALTGVALLLSRSRVEGPLGARSPPAFAARRCYSDDLPCLLAAVSDSRRRVVLTTAARDSLPLVLNLLASWQRLGQEGRVGSASDDAAVTAAHVLGSREAAGSSRPVGAPELGSTRAVEHFLVAALDVDAFQALRARGIPVYWDPAPISALNEAPLQRAPSFSSSDVPLELLLRVVEWGFHAFFCAPDAVWLANPLDEVTWGAEPSWQQAPQPQLAHKQLQQQGLQAVPTDAGAVNPVLGHTCEQPRLGDAPAAPSTGTAAGAAATGGSGGSSALLGVDRGRGDCSGGASGQWTYDIIGMRRSSSGGGGGSVDLSCSYLRASNRTVAHLSAAAALQAQQDVPASAQDAFDAALLLGSPPARGVAPPNELGPARLRVALFDPAVVIVAEGGSACQGGTGVYGQSEGGGGSRLSVSPFIIRAANCGGSPSGTLAAALSLARRGLWFVRLWDDRQVIAVAAGVLAWVALRTARLIARARPSKAAPASKADR